MDHLHRFLFEELNIRGELVTLTDSYQQVLSSYPYPVITQQLLGQMMAASALLSSTLKLEGHLSLQAKGDGELSLLMAECTHQQDLRAIARGTTSFPTATTLRTLIGSGHFCVTLTPDKGQRYQGIVPLDGDTIASCLEHYFEASEQLPTRLIIASNSERASGLLLQVMPGHDLTEDGWNRVTQLAQSLTNDELLNLDHSTLLNRLFHEELIRLYDPSSLRFNCSCSQERTAQALMAIGQIEAEDIIREHGQIDMHCQFCHQHYRFDSDDVTELFEASGQQLH